MLFSTAGSTLTGEFLIYLFKKLDEVKAPCRYAASNGSR